MKTVMKIGFSVCFICLVLIGLIKIVDNFDRDRIIAAQGENK